MDTFQRSSRNPILSPNKDKEWQERAVFNPCVVKTLQQFHMLYRAESLERDYEGAHRSVSTIFYANSRDGIQFTNQKLFIKPENVWDRFGCEDPRVTFLNDKYYIFYTALSTYPFTAPGIRIGAVITKDFKTIEERHPVTPFNSKAMALFPEKIDGKMVAVLTVNTDTPPAKICLAFFEKEEEMWSESYWNKWYSELDTHVIPLLRHANDHIEVGAPPVKTEKGWLLIYSYIQNYFSPEKIFGVEAILLSLQRPAQVIGKIREPLLFPERDYELYGNVAGITFPSGALIEKEKLSLYYGAADTTCCLAVADLKKLLENLAHGDKKLTCLVSQCIGQGFKRYKHNPIIAPRPEFNWEAIATFNPAAVYEDGKFHIIYRAMSGDDTSVFGYASSRDGMHIDERLLHPIYVPRADFEKKLRPGNSGCEDPRITKFEDEFYMFYTAYDGYTPRVAYTSIKVDDFINKRWNWKYPRVITPPSIDDKDACLLPKKINGKFVIFHRLETAICVNFEENLDFGENNWLVHQDSLIKPRVKYWDNRKFGICAPPIETKFGWLMFFHRVSIPGDIYKVEAALLQLDNPEKVIAKTDAPLFEPEMDYEKTGLIANVVFPCGAVLHNNKIFIYYGGADRVVGVAKMNLTDILKRLGI